MTTLAATTHPPATPDTLHVAAKMAWSYARRARREGVLVEDLYGAAMLAFVECGNRYDETRATPLIGFAARRMHGSTLDLLRRESRERRLRLTAVEELASIDSTPLRSRVDVGGLLARTRTSLDSKDVRLIDELYYQGRSMREVACAQGLTVGQVSRRHQTVLNRLRRHAGVGDVTATQEEPALGAALSAQERRRRTAPAEALGAAAPV